jgi:hypothetical protein
MGVTYRVQWGGPFVGAWNPTGVDGLVVQLGGTSVVATSRYEMS